MSPRRSVLTHVVLGALAGAFVALLDLGPLPFTWRGTAGMLAAGAVGGLSLGAAAYWFRRLSGPALYSAAALAGVAGGTVWWLIVRPASPLLLAAVIGGGIVLLMIFMEDRTTNS
jgi:hypothetical protein